jgi:hypothetical protein
MLISAVLQETYHTQRVGTFIMYSYICTIHNFSNSGLSVIRHLAAATMLLDYFLHST